MKTVKRLLRPGARIGFVLAGAVAILIGCATAPNIPPSSTPSAASEKQAPSSNKGQAARGQFSQVPSPAAANDKQTVKPARGQKPLETATAENVSSTDKPKTVTPVSQASPSVNLPAAKKKSSRELSAERKAEAHRAARAAREAKAAQEAQAKAEAKAEQEARARADREAKAEAEARAKQEAKAAQEAKVRETRAAREAKAEQEAKAKADARAEQEARAEAIAREKREAKAEREARIAEKAKSRRTESTEAKVAKTLESEASVPAKTDPVVAEPASAQAPPSAPKAETPAEQPKPGREVALSAGSSVTIPTQALQGAVPEDNDPIKAGPTEPPAPTPEEYRIGPGDVLAFHSFDDPALDAPVVVRFDGFVSLPMIKDIKITGMTREEAKAALETAYAEFFKKPDLSLSITEAKSRQYWVMGDVNRPAPYPYTQPITLLEAINMAGGLRVNTRGGEVYVGSQGQLVKALLFRHTAGRRQVYDFDLKQLKKSGPHVSDTLLIPGDIVYVPESMNLVYVLGEVRMPNAYSLTEDMSLLQLLARAGGMSDSTGRLKDVAVIHQADASNTQISVYDVRKMLKTGGDVKVTPGDIVYVSRKKLLRAQEFAARLTGSVLPYINIQQQVFSLYTQAYDAWYTKDRYDRLFNDSTNNTLSLDQTIRDLAAIRTLTQPSAK